MNRTTLPTENLRPDALAAIAAFHGDVVTEVQNAVAANDVVVVGMAQNPVVKNVRKALDEAKINYVYLEYGSYFKGWKPRLAIKLWSGWPTYPQVFVKGKLVGGCDETVKALEAGTLIQS
jgi:glutaredoxin-related protein